MIDIVHFMDQSGSKRQKYGYYPLFVDLKGKRVVVIGGGRVAERKVQSLVDAGGSVELISPKLTARLLDMARAGEISVSRRGFRAGDLEGAWLVISATDDQEVQEMVVEEAGRRRIFCNVVDMPDKCSFIVPSLVRRGDLCIAISTAGRSPAVAKRLRREMEEAYPVIWDNYIRLLGRLRDFVLSSSDDPEERKRMCSALADPDVLEWLSDGDWESIMRWAEETCGAGAGKTVEGVRSDA